MFSVNEILDEQEYLERLYSEKDKKEDKELEKYALSIGVKEINRNATNKNSCYNFENNKTIYLNIANTITLAHGVRHTTNDLKPIDNLSKSITEINNNSDYKNLNKQVFDNIQSINSIINFKEVRKFAIKNKDLGNMSDSDCEKSIDNYIKLSLIFILEESNASRFALDF